MNQNPFQIRKYAQTKKNQKKTTFLGTMMDVEKVGFFVFLRKSWFFQENPIFP